MANDKKFIVKNGLQSENNVLVGTSTDDGSNKLQVDGSSIFTNDSGGQVIATFEGDSSNLQIINPSFGDYEITNSGQNNGIKFYNDTDGIEVVYNNSVDLEFSSTGIDFKREPQYLGNVFWNAGNDGAGSGLDADLLDGIDSLQFLRSDEDDTFDGNLTITGDLTVSGNTTYVNTEQVFIADNLLTLNSNFTSGVPTENAGWEVLRGDSANSSLQWDETNDWFKLISAGTDLGRIITTADEGSGNGFDADTVDGLEAEQFLRADADDTATGNITIEGDLTVGDGNGTSSIKLAASGGTETLAATGGEIGFLNSSFNFAIKVKTNDDVEVRDNILAQEFVDLNDNTYKVVPSTASIMNNIDLEGGIRHNGNTTTQINFPLDNRIGFSLAGSQTGLMTTSYFYYNGDIYANKLIDNDDNSYYIDPDSSSVLNTVGIDSEIFHNGDADTKIAFATDTINLATGGATRLAITDAAVTSSVDLVAPRLLDSDNNSYLVDPSGTSIVSQIQLDDYVTHNGNVTTRFGFKANDDYIIDIAGSEKLSVNATRADFTIPVYASQFVDTDNNSYFLDPASTSELNTANFYSGAANNSINIGIGSAERFNIDVTDTQGYIRYIQDEGGGIDHSVNFEIISSSVGLNRFNFNRPINAGGNSITAGFGVFTSGVYSPIYYDYDDETYYADYNNTAVSIKMAGQAIGGNGTAALPTYSFVSDPDTGMYRRTTNSIGFSAGGSEQLRVNTNNVVAATAMQAPIFYDAGDTNYYADPASTSVMSQIDIDDYIRHKGNTISYFGFDAANSYGLWLNNVKQLNLDLDSADFTQHVYSPRFYTNDYLTHNGDENTYIGFNADDTFGVWTAGANRLSITNAAATFNVPVYANAFYDTDDNAYYLDPNSTSVLKEIGIDTAIFHNGDTDTRMSFTDNQIAFDADSATRLTIKSTEVVSSVDMRAPIYYGPGTGTTYFFDPQASGTSASLVGDGKILLGNVGTETRWTDSSGNGGITIAPHDALSATSNPTIGISGNNGGYTLAYLNRIDLGNNPFNASNHFIDFMNDGSNIWSLRGDGLGNAYNIMDADGNYYFMDSGAGGLLSIFGGGEGVAVGSDSVTYQNTDASPTSITPAANKLHVSGGIQIDSASGLLSIGRANGADANINEATFLGVNELGFSAGGGFFMDNTTTVKLRNNLDLFTTGNFYGGRYYDGNDGTYYLDPASTSVLNRVDLDDYIRHNGDLNNYFGFDADDQQVFYTGGTRRLFISDTGVQADLEMRSPIFKDSVDTDYSWNPNTNSAHRFSTPQGYVDIGPRNATYSHFETDMGKFFFNKQITIDTGEVSSYNENLNLRRAESATARMEIQNGLTWSYQTLGVQTGTVGTAPARLIVQTNTQADTNPGDIYADIQFKVAGTPGGLSASGIVGTDQNTIAMITAEDFRTGSTSNEDSGMGFYTSPSGAALRYMGGVSSTGAWYFGNLRGTDTRGRAYFENEVYSSRYYDRNNTAYYLDPASTSITNTMQANRYNVRGSTYFIDESSSDVGSIRVEGAKGGYAGYMIRDDWGFVSDGNSMAGIYNDTRNEWALQAEDNNRTVLFSNGVAQLSAENGFAKAYNSMRSPIYYPPSGTSRLLDLDAANTTQSLKIGGQILREGYDTTSNGDNNKFLVSQDYSSWIWNTSTNWGMFWAGNNGAAYERFGSSNPNEIVFVGAGNVRASIDLDDGNLYAQGEVYAGNYNLDAGNESFSLNPSYAVGIAEMKLFDATRYWEKRMIQPLQGVENPPTTVTSEYVKNNNNPGATSYVLRTASYRSFDSDYIEVESGEEIYGEVSVRTISGTGGLLYMGVRRYDKDKKPIAANDGITYFVVGGNNQTDTNWQTFSGHHTLPTSHTAYNGSDGGAVKYVRLILLMNHSTGGALREFSAPILKRTRAQSRIRTDFDIYAGRYYDSADENFYLDPASTSKLNVVDASNFRDRDNTARFMNPATGGNVQGSWNWNNGSIENLNNLTFNDPGVNEGIKWNGGNLWQIYESPDNQTNAAGSLQFTSGTGNGTRRMWLDTNGDLYAQRYMRATRFIDSNDGNYYADPAGSSIFANLYLRTGGLKMQRNYGDNSIWFNAGSDTNHVLWNHYYGGPTTRGAAASGGFDGMKWNTYAGLHIQGGTGGAFNLARFHTTGAGNGNAHYVQLYANNVEQLGTRAGYGFAPNSMRSPIFYDSDDAAYYGDFASTSRMNTIIANMYSLDNGWDIYDDDSDTLSIRSNNSDHGEIIFRDSNSTDCGRIYFDDDNHWGFKSPDNEWQIYLERNGRTILYYNGTQQARTQNGYFEVNNELRTPIFRDTDDPTNFYVNPNGTSRIRGLTTIDVITTPGVTGYSQALRARDNRIIQPNEDAAGQLKFGFTSWNNDNNSPYADYLHMRSYTDSSGGSDNLLSFKKNNYGIKLWQRSFGSSSAYDTSRLVALYDHNYNTTSDGQHDLYARRFFSDSDTGRYLYPSGKSQLNEVRINGGNALEFTTANGNLRGYIRATDTNDSHLQIATSSGEDIEFLDGGFGGGRNFLIRGDGNVYTTGTHYAQRFTDSNNGNYYGDFASTSVTNSIDNRGEIYNDGWFRNDTSGRGLYNTSTEMHWYSPSNNEMRLYGTGNTLRLNMHTSGNNRRGTVYATNANEIGFLSQDDGWALRTNNSVVDSHHNFYAPIMYDRNDSGYYSDPNGTSRMNTVRANYFTNDGGASSDDGFGLYWDSGRSTAYAIYREAGGWTYRYPDLRIAFHTGIKLGANANYNGIRFYTDYDMSGQVMSVNNATDPLGGGNVYVNNNLQAGSSLRAPIFYDSNNTGYYFDGASSHSTRFEGANARTMAWLGQPGHTRDSGEYYRARPRITGDSNYWTGSYGWGTQDMTNAVADWGSGFIDSWSNPANQPAGTSHWVGMQAYHYSNGSARYGWQMVGGPIDNLRFRKSWSGFSSWRTIPVLGVNNYNNAAMYANIFYDSDNTGYYCDPSSFSNFNSGVRATEIYARNWFRNDNAREGMYNQSTGAHSYSYQGQYWAITGNNNSSSMSLQLRAAYNGTMCRWMYGDRTWSGDLNAAGQWQFQTRHQDGYSPSLRFIESGNESWTGNIGNDAGKLEYHSNRFYLEAGGNSSLIVQFRRNGSNRSYIDNNGLYVGTATSARWADLAERYSADAIYENATVMGINLDGESEITKWEPGMPLVGVISTNPAVQMNDMGIKPGSNSKKAKMNPFIALKGRVPCLVNSDVKKGQWVIPCGNGKAKGVDYGTPGIMPHEIIGIAISDSKDGEVEVKV